VNIVVNADLQQYIDPLTPEEHDALERSLLAEGCRDALVLWGDLLVDGHNRYGICTRHGIPFQTVQNTRFRSIEDVHLWMIDQHLGRRSVSDFQRGVLALRKKEILEARQAAAREAERLAEVRGEARPLADEADALIGGVPAAAAQPLKTREAVARAAKLSSAQVGMIEKIQKQAAPEVVAALKSGTISISAAAAVASLPVDEQVAAASAGRDELKQAARRARDAGRKPRAAAALTPAHAAAAAVAVDAAAEGEALAALPPEVRALHDRIAELTAENEYLRGQVAELQAQLAAN
jgi:hypothetical protein